MSAPAKTQAAEDSQQGEGRETSEPGTNSTADSKIENNHMLMILAKFEKNMQLATAYQRPKPNSQFKILAIKQGFYITVLLPNLVVNVHIYAKCGMYLCEILKASESKLMSPMTFLICADWDSKSLENEILDAQIHKLLRGILITVTDNDFSSFLTDETLIGKAIKTGSIDKDTWKHRQLEDIFVKVFGGAEYPHVHAINTCKQGFSIVLDYCTGNLIHKNRVTCSTKENMAIIRVLRNNPVYITCQISSLNEQTVTAIHKNFFM